MYPRQGLTDLASTRTVLSPQPSQGTRLRATTSEPVGSLARDVRDELRARGRGVGQDENGDQGRQHRKRQPTQAIRCSREPGLLACWWLRARQREGHEAPASQHDRPAEDAVKTEGMREL